MFMVLGFHMGISKSIVTGPISARVAGELWRRVTRRQQRTPHGGHSSTHLALASDRRTRICCSDWPGNFLMAQSTHLSPSTYSAVCPLALSGREHLAETQRA